MTKLGDRLDEALKMLEFKTQKEVAQLIGISRSHMSEIIRGKKHPSEIILTIIEGKLGINKDWLKDGKQPMFLDKAQRNKMPFAIGPASITGGIEIKEREPLDYKPGIKGTRAPVNEKLLENIIEALEGFLDREGIDLKPEGKAKIITYLYKRLEEKKIDLEEMAEELPNIVRLVA